METSMIVTTKNLFPDWHSRLLEELAYEATQSQVKLLQDEGRNGVWKMCLWFGCEANGVPGQACRLFERFLFNFLHNIDIDENENDDFLESLQAQVPTLIASCITLAAKMNNAASSVSAKAVHMILKCKGITCLVEDLIAAEFKVYNALDFRVPLWTNVEIGELLAVEVGYPLDMLEDVARVVDRAEYKRCIVNRKVRWAAKLTASSSGGVVLSLHLAAGAVAAAGLLARDTRPDPVPRLAALTEAPRNYIKCIQDVICAEIISKIRQSE